MELYSLLGVTPGITAIIGSGGKSTTLEVLSQELPGTVLLCTSTHFMGYPHLPTVLNPTKESLRDAFCHDRVVCTARQTVEGKLVDCGLPYELLQQYADYVLVEADGSRRLPLKAHAAHEPAIPDPCGQIICVVGLSGLGKPISEFVHRSEIFCSLTGAAPEELTSPTLVAKGLLAENLADTYFLNQADQPWDMGPAQALAAELTAVGKDVVAGSLHQKEYLRL